MSKLYSVTGPSSSSTGPKTAVGVGCTAAIRCMVNEVLVGSSTTPADVVFTVDVNKTSTTLGTSTGVTPTPLDNGDVACVCVGGKTYTGEPTTAFNMLHFPMNQRATFRWVAQDGREIIPAAGAATGVAATMTLAGTALVMDATIIFRE